MIFRKEPTLNAMAQLLGAGFLAAVLALPIPVQAQQEQNPSSENRQKLSNAKKKLVYGAEVDFLSGFLWRGMTLTDKPVTQPAAWISKSGLSFTVWSSTHLTHEPGAKLFNFTDLILTYSRDWKKLTIEPTLEGYVNRPPTGEFDPHTMEVALKLSYPIGPFTAFTSHAIDLIAYRGAYFGETGITYKRTMKKTDLELTIRSGWASSKFNNGYIGVNKPAVNFVGVDGGLAFNLNSHLYIRPHLEFNRMIDRQLRAVSLKPTFFTFGLTMGMEF